MEENLRTQIGQLRSTLAKMEIALDSVKSAIVWTNNRGEVQWCNTVFEQLTNRRKLMVFGQSLADIFPLYTTDKVLDSELHPIHIALREKKNGLEYYEFNYSGNILILEVNWSSVTFDQNGNSAVFVIRDVTEVKEAEAELQAHRQHLEVLVEDRTIELTQTNRKLQQEIVDRQHIEQALRTSEERFRLLIDNVKDYGIYLLDPQGYIVSWNAGAERINGYRAEEIIGQHLSCFFYRKILNKSNPKRS